MDLTPKQQTSEAIRQSQSILILTGQHPSIDQASALIALGMILRKFGKQASSVMSENLPPAFNSISQSSIIEHSLGGPRDFILKVDLAKTEVDKLRYEIVEGKLHVIITPFKGNFAPSDVTFDYGVAAAQFDLIIVIGVPSRARIDRIYDQAAGSLSQVPVINLDFHRSNENYGAINLIDPNATSLCEILVALSESLQSGIIDAEIATPLLMGIMASTDRFTANHTTPKSLTVAAQMMAAGATQSVVVKALYRDTRSIDNRNSNDSRANDGSRSPSNRERPLQPRRDANEARRDQNEPRRDVNDARRDQNDQRRDASDARRESSEPRREPAEPRRDSNDARRDQAAPRRDAPTSSTQAQSERTPRPAVTAPTAETSLVPAPQPRPEQAPAPRLASTPEPSSVSAPASTNSSAPQLSPQTTPQADYSPRPAQTPEPLAPKPDPVIVASPVVPNLDAAVRQADTSPELPIIAPRHIEMSSETGEFGSAAQTHDPSNTSARPGAPTGQLPPEMSPLMSARTTAPTEPIAPAPQNAARPSMIRDDA